MYAPEAPPYPIHAPRGYAELRPHVERRYASGLTQEAIARAAGWSPSYVSTLERGVRIVSPASLARYVDALARCEALDTPAPTR